MEAFDVVELAADSMASSPVPSLELELLSPPDWDLASIESTLSPAALDSDALELGDWLGMDGRAEEIWQWQPIWPPSGHASMPSPSSSSSSPFYSTSSIGTFEEEADPLLVQARRNQEISTRLSPFHKFQECLQRVQRRLGQQQRRKFSLKNGAPRDGDGTMATSGGKASAATKGRRNAASRISVRKWREEMKNMLKMDDDDEDDDEEEEKATVWPTAKRRRMMDKSQ